MLFVNIIRKRRLFRGILGGFHELLERLEKLAGAGFFDVWKAAVRFVPTRDENDTLPISPRRAMTRLSTRPCVSFLSRSGIVRGFRAWFFVFP
ncbi:MAG: hypothetical protein LBI87_15490 [Candidatus Accumulibacter sp.]|nr:hypothetical protein [Accumulibacter sp.]